MRISTSSSKAQTASFKAALVSLLMQSDLERNLCAVARAVEDARTKDCQLVCLPECAVTGLPSGDYEADIDLASDIPGHIANRMADLAQSCSVYIATGILERAHGQLYDTAVLFDNRGEIALKYRRINPRWHSNKAPKDLYVEGAEFNLSSTPFGRIGFAVCGDIFDDRVVAMIQGAKPDYLIIPLSRRFDEDCYDEDQWEKEEKWSYVRQIGRIGVTSLLVNSLEPLDRGASFGGSLVVSRDGQIIAETGIGEPSILVCELPRVA